MKHIIIFIFCIFLLNLYGQNGYKWINFPTFSGILDEYEDREQYYRLLNGKVKEIEFLSYDSISTEATGKITAKYSENGSILSIQQIGFDSESSKTIYFLSIKFEYDKNNKIIRESITESLEGKKIKHSKKDTQEMFFSEFPEPISKDQYGNSLSITLDGDTTYSFYDELGRKIMDSIPFGSTTEGAKVKFTYLADSVYCEKMWSSNTDVPSERESYLLDNFGNWIEKKVFYFNDTRWSLMVKRRIIYY